MIFIICILIIVCLTLFNYFDIKKELKESDKAVEKSDRDCETYIFLFSEDGERSRIEVSSLCNQLGIKLESDNEGEETLQ